jgi:peptidoglycan/LPS O-acetylase OafA/YrhL
MTLAVLLTIPVSFLLYWLIEQRFIRIGRRFHGARLPAAVEVA